MIERTVPLTGDPQRLAGLRQALAAHAPGPGTPPAELRAAFERWAGAMAAVDGVELIPAGPGVPPGIWYRPAVPRPGAVLHLHGGGYVFGSSRTIRSLASGLAAATNMAVFALDYRLAPEHPFPAAVDDAFAAYRWLREQVPGSGEVVVSGDSAGGGLAVAAAVRICAELLPLPAALLCLSPWTDLSLASPSVSLNAATDTQVSPAFLAEAATSYVTGADPTTPLASPAYADLTGLPSMMIQVGAEELLVDDARRLAAAADRAGVDVTLECWEGMPHVWQSLVPRLPEAWAALAGIARWLDSVRRRVP